MLPFLCLHLHAARKKGILHTENKNHKQTIYERKVDMLPTMAQR